MLIFAAVPVEHCTAAMLAFRTGGEAMRVPDDALVGHEGMPISSNPENPTLRHWQAGGVVVFGYTTADALEEAQQRLEQVYVTEAGRGCGAPVAMVIVFTLQSGTSSSIELSRGESRLRSTKGRFSRLRACS